PSDPPPPAPAGGLTADILARVMGCTVARATVMLPGYLGAMAAADITNVNRAAMFAAQLGHESVGLQYMEEIASGAAYEGRRDLGNVHPGDGVRYKGSGPIQLTGRANFRAFTQWANAQGHTTLDFEAQPHLVRSNPRWGFLAASWYWTVARPQINRLSDARDLEGVTRAINGGLNGLADRRTRYDRALALGNLLLPPREDDMFSDEDRKMLARVHHELTYRFESRYEDPETGEKSTFRETLVGYILELDKKLESINKVRLPGIQKAIDTIAGLFKKGA
ncbi:MAG: hypothetical protein U1C73_21030, partial [Dietzia sp.]|nr:hypothetical protein [Dietzia sp.]